MPRKKVLALLRPSPARARSWSLALAVSVLGLALGARLLGERPVHAPPAPVPFESSAVEGAAESALAVEPQPAPTAAVAVQTSFAGIAEPPPEPRRTETIQYVVEPGDSLRLIAERFRLRLETLVWANAIENPDLILAGQKLRVPPMDGVFYTVQPADRLADVAEQHGVELGAIVSANRLSDADTVSVGAEVFLPGARPLNQVAQPGRSGPLQAASAGQPEQESADLLPMVALPPNLDELLSAGWLRSQRPTAFFKTAGRDARILSELPEGVRLERLEGFQGGRIQVRDPGNGRTRQAMTGWVNAIDLAVGHAPSPRELPAAYPADTAMDIAHVFAPYRSQLDGSPYAAANCGPTVVSMALEAFGVVLPSGQVRREVLDAQRIWGNNVGTLLTALATVTERHGLKALDLYAPGGGLRRWSPDDVRQHIALGHPVVVQVRYRSLPGRSGAAYYADHYILVTGVVPDGFLYNDSIDHDGIGWDRIITAERLRIAMDASDRRFAYAAFAVSR